MAVEGDASSSSSSPDGQYWWSRVGAGVTFALTRPVATPWLPLREVALAFVQSEVVRSRAVRQFSQLFNVADPEEDFSDMFFCEAFGTVVARSYVEMFIALRSMLQRRAALLEHKDTAGEAEAGAGAGAGAGRGATVPLLVSERSILDAPAVVAAATVFGPVAEMRHRAAQETEAKAREAAGKPASASAAARKEPARDPKDPASRTSDAAVAKIIGDLGSIHALAVAYSTAAGDMFDYPLQLATAQQDPDKSPLQVVESNLCSFDIPAPQPGAPTLSARGGPVGGGTGAGASASAAPRDVPVNLLGPPLPSTFVSHITGLDLHGCIRLAPQNLPLILRFCPNLTVLRLGGCNQFSSSLLVSVAPLLSRLRQLDVEYLINVDDNVLAALGRHCPNLSRLQLVGCHTITDKGLSAEGLFHSCTNLRRLNLRGCKEIGDSGILSIARRCPNMRELCLSGLTSVTAEAIAHVIVQCRRLNRFKGELWFDLPAGVEPDVEGGVQMSDPNAPKKSYRLLGSVRGAIRYIKSIIPPDHPLADALNARYRDTVLPGTGGGGAGAGGGGGLGASMVMGAPLPIDEPRAMEGALMMTPPFQRREDDDSQSLSSAGGGGDVANMAELVGAFDAAQGAGGAGGIMDVENDVIVAPAAWVPGAAGEGEIMRDD